jgi:hypothetical protein
MNMSDELKNKAHSYAEATGLLTIIVEQLLIHDVFDRETIARLFVKVAQGQENLPESVIRLKDDVKRKYNL